MQVLLRRTPRRDALMHLDSDTLRNILEILRPSRGLAALSMTCKWIREACKPIMFQSCNLIIPCTSYFDSSWRRRILPAAIRDYVITLTIECTFHRLGPKWMLSPNASAYDKAYQPFIDALARMPKLRNITLYAAQCDGIPWEAMRAIVTIPQVRSLSFEGLFDRRSSLSRELQALPMYPLAPLERLSYTTEAYQPSPSSTEIDFFVRLFRQAELRKSLEIAEMIGHCAPLELFGGSRWSHLRVLSLHGQQFETYGVSLETPVITLLGGMPALRELTLKTAQPKASAQRYVWPPGLTASLPWPHLEIFAISNLLADDEICTHLPPSLRRLSLLCWPRHYVHRDRRGRDAMDVFGWRSPVLTSSAMLHVLCSCHTPALEQLDIEYRVDYGERDLLRLLASRFPALTMLTIHRYCDDSADEDSASANAAALATLRHLRVLRMGIRLSDYFRSYAYDSEESLSTIQTHADVFAHTLAPEVEFVCFLRRYLRRTRFLPFRIIREAHTRPRAVYERRVLETCGISIRDEDEPPIPNGVFVEY